jgi:hypothetical protein
MIEVYGVVPMRLFNGRLVRKTLAFSKLVEMYRASATWPDLVYNLARPLRLLRLAVNDSHRRWQPRSPATLAPHAVQVWRPDYLTVFELSTSYL